MIDENKLVELRKEWSDDKPWDLANCVELMDTVESLFAKQKEISSENENLWKELSELKRYEPALFEFEENQRKKIERLEKENAELKNQAAECGCWQGHGRGSRCEKLEAVARAAGDVVEWGDSRTPRLEQALAALKEKS